MSSHVLYIVSAFSVVAFNLISVEFYFAPRDETVYLEKKQEFGYPVRHFVQC